MQGMAILSLIIPAAGNYFGLCEENLLTYFFKVYIIASSKGIPGTDSLKNLVILAGHQLEG